VSDNLLDINIRHSLQTANGILPMEVSFSLSKGNILALTGPSGAGKTTLLRQIAGLVNPQSGKISMAQQLWLDTSQNIQVPARKRNIGFVFQDYALFPHMTVKENLLFALEKKGDEKVVDELLEDMELTQLTEENRISFQAGNSSAWHWPGRWYENRIYCCSTSRLRH
jgi:molybdate transport system ATP-binding protein